MLNRIISFSIKNHILVAITAILIAVYGTYITSLMPVDVLPDLNRPIVTVMTEAHSMVPEDVERLITYPLEQVFNGATGVTNVRSASGMGMSIVFVEFDWGTDIYRNRQIVQEKLQLARSKLPADAVPQMTPISSIMGQIQLIGVQSRNGKTDIAQLRTFVDYNIRYRLLSVPGVAQVITTGGSQRQIQIIVDVDKLQLLDVTLDEVKQAIQASNLNKSGGVLNIGAKGPMITVTGLIEHERVFAETVVKYDKVRPILVQDVAKIQFGLAAIRTGEAGIDGKEGVILVIHKQPDTDTTKVTKLIHQEITNMQASLPEDIVVIPEIFEQAKFIERAIHNVIEAVRDGGILVFVVLLLFLFNIRITIITLSAIPLSIAITAIIFHMFGLSINTMTLGGIAVAIGALVDDAIVDVENVYRRLRENAAQPQPQNIIWVIFRASSEVRTPILIGTLLVIVVYLPLFFLSGLEGKLFVPIGISYILSIASSLVVALSVTPVMCLYLLKNVAIEGSHAQETWVVTTLKNFVGTIISQSLQYHKEVIAIFTVCVLIGILLLVTAGSQFLPPFNEGVAQVNMYLPPEVSLNTSNKIAQHLEKILRQIEGVQYVARRTGRAENDEHAHGVNITEIIVNFDPKAEKSRSQIVDDMRHKIQQQLPGIPFEIDQPLSHLLSHMLSGVKAQVAIKIFGEDLETLRKLAKKVEGRIRGIPGVVDLYTEQQVLVDHITIIPKRDRLSQHGITVEEVGEMIELAMEGEQVSLMQRGIFSYPVVIRIEEKDRLNLQKIAQLRVPHPQGYTIALSDVADIVWNKTPNNINRENVARRIVVQHNISGRSLGEVIADVEQALAPIRKEISEKSNYSIRIGGQYEAQVNATRRIVLLSFVSLAIMILVLYIHFRSLRFSLLILSSIPMAFIGAISYIVLSGQIVSVASFVGLISLGGIAARNSILLLDRYIYLMREEQMAFSAAMIIRAGQERMVPVVMTALTSGIALLPIAWAPDQPGREILYPVATVIIGGLISSTLLDFLVIPAMFWVFGRSSAEDLAKTPEKFDFATEEMYAEFVKKDSRSILRE